MFFQVIFSSIYRFKPSMSFILLQQIFLSPLNLSIYIYIDLLSIFNFSTNCRFFSFYWKNLLFYLLKVEIYLFRSRIIYYRRPFYCYWDYRCYFKVSIQQRQIWIYWACCPRMSLKIGWEDGGLLYRGMYSGCWWWFGSWGDRVRRGQWVWYCLLLERG